MLKPGLKLLPCRRPGVEAVEADTARAFGRHTHEHFGIGLIGRGAQKSASGRGMVEAAAGDIVTVNPGEVHDGTPLGDSGRAWQMLYLDPPLVAELAGDIGEGSVANFEFHRPAFHDEVTAGHFRALFRAVTAGTRLQADEQLLRLLAALLQPRLVAAVPAGIARARTRIDDDPTDELSLETLAREAGLGRFQLLRAFARATGLPPHAYQVQRRIHRARALIAAGHALADAAAASGFADQSHMTRCFVRSFGIAPGAYARAARSREAR